MTTQQQHQEQQHQQQHSISNKKTSTTITEKDASFQSSLNSKPRGRALDVILVLPSSPSSTASTAAASSDFIVSFTHTYKSSSFTNLLSHPHGSNHTTSSSLTHYTDKVCGGIASCVHGDLCSHDTTIPSPPPPPNTEQFNSILQHGWKVEVYINNTGPINELEMRYLGTKKDVKRLCKRNGTFSRHSKEVQRLNKDNNGGAEEKESSSSIQNNGLCVFVTTKSTKPSPGTLSFLLSTSILTSDLNTITYILYSNTTTIAAVASSHLYLWSSCDNVICSDIDGTVTKSDVSGVINTVLFDKFHKEDSAHEGICEFYSELERRGGRCSGGDEKEEEEKKEVVTESSQPPPSQEKGQLRFLYLSSRPLALIEKTKGYLSTLTQSSSSSSSFRYKLPEGPILCHIGSVGEVLWTELVKKNIYEFKAGVLVKQVLEVFRLAGRLSHEKVFVAGFGNKKTDAIAYSMAGIKRHDIYIINKESRLVCLDNHLDDDVEEEEEEVHHDYVKLSSSAPPPSKTKAMSCCIVDVESMNYAISKERKEEKEKERRHTIADIHTTNTDGANPVMMMEAPQYVSMRQDNDEEKDKNIDSKIRQRTTEQQQEEGRRKSEIVDNPQQQQQQQQQHRESSFRRRKRGHSSLKNKMPLYEKYIGTTYCGYKDPKLLLDVSEKTQLMR